MAGDKKVIRRPGQPKKGISPEVPVEGKGENSLTGALLTLKKSHKITCITVMGHYRMIIFKADISNDTLKKLKTPFQI